MPIIPIFHGLVGICRNNCSALLYVKSYTTKYSQKSPNSAESHDQRQIIFFGIQIYSFKMRQFWFGQSWVNLFVFWCGTIDILSYSVASEIPVALRIVKCWNISHHSQISYYIYWIYHSDHKAHENMYVYLWFWWLMFQHLTIVNALGIPLAIK